MHSSANGGGDKSCLHHCCQAEESATSHCPPSTFVAPPPDVVVEDDEVVAAAAVAEEEELTSTMDICWTGRRRGRGRPPDVATSPTKKHLISRSLIKQKNFESIPHSRTKNKLQKNLTSTWIGQL